ncbi:MAG: hypothetical protein RL026_696 [Pseudomonadota bacterium]|jgi:peroxiredoxin
MRRHTIASVIALAGMLWASPPAQSMPASGTPAPAFELPTLQGHPLALASLRGQVVLVNFWATWCGPCRQEMPLLEQMHRKYQPLGVTVLGVNVEPDSATALQWLQTRPVSFPVVSDKDGAVSRLYGVPGMPGTVILDRKGVVRFAHAGYRAGDETLYLDQLRKLAREP